MGTRWEREQAGRLREAAQAHRQDAMEAIIRAEVAMTRTQQTQDALSRGYVLRATVGAAIRAGAVSPARP